MIPKIIHQLWIGPTPAPRPWMDTWRELNPEWTYMFWNEAKLREAFPNGLRNQRQFNAMDEWCGKCDIARVEILNKFGGFFVDADSLCLSPLDDFLLKNDSFTCYENEFVCGQLVACGYLATIPQNMLMEMMIEQIGRLDIGRIKAVERTSAWDASQQAWQLTGNALLTKTIFQNRYTPITIYPSHYFIPEHYSGLKHRGIGKTYCRHLWGSTVGSSYFNYKQTVED